MVIKLKLNKELYVIVYFFISIGGETVAICSFKPEQTRNEKIVFSFLFIISGALKRKHERLIAKK